MARDPRALSATGLVVPDGSPLYAALARLARDGRMVFFAGLPGTGKSLLIHQLAHLAHAQGRQVHLLQWDVARPVFEASPAGRAYPQDRGVTHGIIRLAVGEWARAAVERWHAQHGRGDLLIGETPLVGHRLVALARPAADAAEAVLAAPSSRFVIPVPSRELRAHLEAERERRARTPLHPREREDAPPHVLRDLWRELVDVARALGMRGEAASASGDAAYHPALYQDVYERLLAHRHAEALLIDTKLPTSDLSPYAFGMSTPDLVPTSADAERAIQRVAVRYADPAALEREVRAWYRVP